MCAVCKCRCVCTMALVWRPEGSSLPCLETARFITCSAVLQASWIMSFHAFSLHLLQMCSATSGFTWVLGSRTQVLMPVMQALYPWSLPSPTFVYFGQLDFWSHGKGSAVRHSQAPLSTLSAKKCNQPNIKQDFHRKKRASFPHFPV